MKRVRVVLIMHVQVVDLEKGNYTVTLHFRFATTLSEVSCHYYCPSLPWPLTVIPSDSVGGVEYSYWTLVSEEVRVLVLNFGNWRFWN